MRTESSRSGKDRTTREIKARVTNDEFLAVERIMSSLKARMLPATVSDAIRHAVAVTLAEMAEASEERRSPDLGVRMDRMANAVSDLADLIRAMPSMPDTGLAEAVRLYQRRVVDASERAVKNIAGSKSSLESLDSSASRLEELSGTIEQMIADRRKTSSSALEDIIGLLTRIESKVSAFEASSPFTGLPSTATKNQVQSSDQLQVEQARLVERTSSSPAPKIELTSDQPSGSRGRFKIPSQEWNSRLSRIHAAFVGNGDSPTNVFIQEHAVVGDFLSNPVWLVDMDNELRAKESSHYFVKACLNLESECLVFGKQSSDSQHFQSRPIGKNDNLALLLIPKQPDRGQGLLGACLLHVIRNAGIACLFRPRENRGTTKYENRFIDLNWPVR